MTIQIEPQHPSYELASASPAAESGLATVAKLAIVATVLVTGASADITAAAR